MKYDNEKNTINEEILELPVDIVEKLVCKQLLNPINTETVLLIISSLPQRSILFLLVLHQS